MPDKSVSYRDVVRVAAAAGVTPKTAAKHLGGEPGSYSTIARDAVLKAAAELGVRAAVRSGEVRR
jgi:DNA-binding LacI/PurR family transcriptional regulator